MKKIIAIILAVVVIAAAVCLFMFRDKAPEPIKPSEPEVSTPVQDTEPEETEPKPTTPIDPNAWNLAVLETDPEFQDVTPDEYEKEGIDFVTTSFVSPHLSIDDIDNIFGTNKFLKQDIIKNKVRN